jgi:agmatinase
MSGQADGGHPRVFHDLPEEMTDPASAAAAILPVPYDATASWLKGTAGGPAAIMEASQYVEIWDVETASEPWRRGITTLAALEVDDGPEELAREVKQSVGEILDRGQLPVMLGGEHSVTIGAALAAAERFAGLSVLQIDAHADTRESYHGSSYNHACVMARVREVCPIVQVGIRSVDTGEVAGLEDDRVFWAHEIIRDRENTWIPRAVELLTGEVYVTIDVDGFDPSIVPATGTPEPGGLDWYQVTDLLAAVAGRHRVVGFDVVELLPDHPPSAFTAAKLIYRFLAEIFSVHPERAT